MANSQRIQGNSTSMQLIHCYWTTDKPHSWLMPPCTKFVTKHIEQTKSFCISDTEKELTSICRKLGTKPEALGNTDAEKNARHSPV